jgi:hypothetical protein
MALVAMHRWQLMQQTSRTESTRDRSFQQAKQAGSFVTIGEFSSSVERRF